MNTLKINGSVNNVKPEKTFSRTGYMPWPGFPAGRRSYLFEKSIKLS